jgi:hypothetical protein
VEGNVITFGSEPLDRESLELLCMLDLLDKPIGGWMEANTMKQKRGESQRPGISPDLSLEREIDEDARGDVFMQTNSEPFEVCIKAGALAPRENRDGIKVDVLLRHICETCGKEEMLTSEEGFNQGWDYPPRMGAFGIVSPRTCGNCLIDTTLWWEITCNKTPVGMLSQRHLRTMERILGEPQSILP